MKTEIQKLKRKLIFWFKLVLLSPGIIVHELAHTFFCLISGVKIFKIKIFQFSEVAGYVEHEEADDIFGAFLISFGPIFINTALSFYLFKEFGLKFEWKNVLFLYLAISIALSAIPSNGDAGSFGDFIKHSVEKHFWLFFIYIFYPLVWLLNLLNYLKKFYFDYIFVLIIFYLALF